jgi:hypothetical protein
MTKENKIQVRELPKLSVCEVLFINFLSQNFHEIQLFIYLRAILTVQNKHICTLEVSTRQ